MAVQTSDSVSVRRHKKERAGAVAVIALILTVISTKTGFSAVEPNSAQAKGFLKTYYSKVVGGNCDWCWERLDEDYLSNSKSLRENGRRGYDEYWATVKKVDVEGVKHDSGYSFDARLKYTYRDSRRASETNTLELRCPPWTAFTVGGCTPENISIHNVEVGP